MPSIKVEAQGLQNIRGAFGELINIHETGKVFRKAGTEAAKILRAEMKSTIRSVGAVRTGALVRSISSKVKFYQSGTMVILIGPRRDYSQSAPPGINTKTGRIVPAFYFHLVDLGAPGGWNPKVKAYFRRGGFKDLVRQRWQHPGFSGRRIREKTLSGGFRKAESAMIRVYRLGILKIANRFGSSL